MCDRELDHQDFYSVITRGGANVEVESCQIMEGNSASGSMHEISSMDRTSSFVRTLVRMQLSQNRRSSKGAMDRLYERMKERGEDVDFNSPKVSRRLELSHTSEQSASTTEDDDEDCDAGVQVTRSAHAKRSAETDTGSAKRNELLRTSTGGFLYTPRRRSPMARPPSPAEEDTVGHQGEKKVYTVTSANHSLAMNRGLTLAASVKKNYSRYIRTEKVETQDENRKDTEDSLLTEQRQLNPQTKEVSFAEISVPDSRKTDTLLSVPSLMNRSSSSLGLITTIEEDLPGEMARSNSALSVPICASLPATPDRAQMQTGDLTETHATTTHAQRSRKGTVKKTEGRFRRRSSSNQEDRAIVIKELHKAHSLMDEHTKEVLLRQARARSQAYKREQQLREEKMAIFNREMDDVMKRLRDINNRLDCRLRILERDETLAKLES